MDLAADQVAAGIRDNMALSSFDAFARVIAGKRRVFRGFHTLAVDHTPCRMHIPSGRVARLSDQRPVDLGEQAIVASAIEIVAHLSWNAPPHP